VTGGEWEQWVQEWAFNSGAVVGWFSLGVVVVLVGLPCDVLLRHGGWVGSVFLAGLLHCCVGHMG